MSKPFAIATKNKAGESHVVRYEVLSRYATKEAHSVPPDRFENVYGTAGVVQPLYNLEALARILEVNTWHDRCVKVKAHDVAGSGWGLTPIAGDEDEANEESKKKLDTFFNQLEPSIDVTLTRSLQDFEAVGIGALELVQDFSTGEPLDLQHVVSYTIRVHKDRNKFCQVLGLKKIWFKRFGYEKDIDYRDGTEHELGSLPENRRANVLLTFNNYSPRSDAYGSPDILPALGAVEGLLSLRDYNLKFFDNYGIPSYAIYITGDYNLGVKVDDAGKEEGDEGYDSTTGEYPIIRIVKEHLQTIQSNPHAPLILAVPSQTPEGTVEVKFEPLNVQVKDASFTIYKKNSRDEILVAHGVPGYRVGITETGALGGSTAKEATDIYKISVVKPRKAMIEALVNKYIVREGFEITDWKWFLEDFDPKDIENDRETADFLFARGAMTPNQLIIYFGEPFGLKKVEDVPAMDWHYINNQAIETGDIMRDEIIDSVKDLNDHILELVKK